MAKIRLIAKMDNDKLAKALAECIKNRFPSVKVRVRNDAVTVTRLETETLKEAVRNYCISLSATVY